ncbi:MAG: ABC transporter transmembrane domain-containing protein [Rhodobacteraceae bacterium]|nr:ABC transporter transmembrane domain-containing protein [Paracoccaceae bacterium]
MLIMEPEQNRTQPGRLSALLALVELIRPHRRLALGALAALVGTASATLVLPLFVSRFVDNFIDAPLADFNRSFLWALVIACALAAGTALRYALVTRLGEVMVVNLRSRVFDRVVTMSPAFFERIRTGEVTSRINTDTTLVLTLISTTVSVAVRNLMILAGGLVLMAVTSPRLTLLAMVLVPAILLPIVILGRLLRRQSRENQDHMAHGAATVSEVLLNIQIVQAFTREQTFRDRFRAIGNAYLDSVYRRIITRAALTASVIILVFAGIATVIWVAAGDARSHAISVGQLVQFVIYAILVGGAVSTLADVWGEVLRAAGATDRILELLALDDDINDPAVPQPVPTGLQSGLRFTKVNFTYPHRPDVPVLRDLSFSVAPGEMVAP